MNSMVLAIATRRWEGWERCVQTWHATATRHHFQFVVCDCDVMQAYQIAYETTVEPVIGMIHDDVEIYEKGWDESVLREFDDPGVGLVGFGGALGHGAPHLYTAPYHLPNLARQSFMSNMRSAEKHGARFTRECDVAVLDGFALFVRRTILDTAGGWPVDKPYGYWLYSEWLCCETRRQGYRIRLVGVDVEHLGGKSSGFIATSPTYEEAHRYLWENNWDMLPYRVKE
jgi:GT2 family glycosyltransferase